MEILHEAGADDDPAVTRIARYLASITTDGGGVPFVLPTVRDAPHGPWWRTPDDPPGAINPTATLAGLLHRARADHPWLGPATGFCWRYLEAPGAEPGGYDVLAVLTFLDHVPDRDRAEAAFTRVRDVLAAHATSDHQGPLDFAPAPGGYGRRSSPPARSTPPRRPHRRAGRRRRMGRRLPHLDARHRPRMARQRHRRTPQDPARLRAPQALSGPGGAHSRFRTGSPARSLTSCAKWAWSA
ncbi:hypothetical protein ACFQY7_01855 [Actinomadura luteofluorescens]|uniref:hypothetical protein n=1 Tax=Actinomadura luteofluorescens TaxID=46163 RepID=UPI0036395F96